MSKRVGIFSIAYSPFVGGAELAIEHIASRIDGYDFTCFTHRFDQTWLRQERIGNVEVVRLGNGRGFWAKFLYVFRAWRAAETIHKEKPFDVIWAMMAAYGGLSALLFKMRHPSVPLLLTLQEGDSEQHILRRVGFFYFFWKKIFQNADRIQVISAYLRDFARRHGAKREINIIPNGVDFAKVKRQKAKGKSKEGFVIITTSRLVYKNGIDTLIRSLSLIPIHYSLVLRILGAGPDEQKLRQLAREEGVVDRVEFVGHVIPEKIADELARADIFVRPSRSEGLGSSFLEAMAAGLPIIGTPVGGIPDFLKDGETGLFVRVDDPQDVAEKIARLMQDGALREKLSENGRTLVEERYSWDRVAGEMRIIFQQLS